MHDSLKKVLDTEIKTAKVYEIVGQIVNLAFNRHLKQIQKNLYDCAKVDLSNAQTKLASALKTKNQEKIDTCTLELEETKKRYEEVEKTTFLTLRDSISVSEYKLLESLIEYVECQRSFYDRGFQMVNEMTLEIYDYRNHADAMKTEIQANSQKKQRMTRIINPVQQQYVLCLSV